MAESKPSEALPYWLVNVPKTQWPAECPDFLRDISERDKAMISIPESEFHRLTWPEVQELVSKYLYQAGMGGTFTVAKLPKRLTKSINLNAVLRIIADI